MASSNSDRLLAGAPLVWRAGHAPQRDLRHGRGLSDRLVEAEQAGGGLAVSAVTVYPGTQPGPYHRHARAQNTYYVIDGELEVRADGIAHQLAAGESIFIPAGVGHATHNRSDKPSRFLAVYDRDISDDFEVIDAPEASTEEG